MIDFLRFSHQNLVHFKNRPVFEAKIRNFFDRMKASFMFSISEFIRERDSFFAFLFMCLELRGSCSHSENYK